MFGYLVKLIHVENYTSCRYTTIEDCTFKSVSSFVRQKITWCSLSSSLQETYASGLCKKAIENSCAVKEKCNTVHKNA